MPQNQFVVPNNAGAPMQGAIDAHQNLTPARSSELDTILAGLQDKLVGNPGSIRPQQMYKTREELANAPADYQQAFNEYELANTERYGQKEGNRALALAMMFAPLAFMGAPALGLAGAPGGAGAAAGAGVTELGSSMPWLSASGAGTAGAGVTELGTSMPWLSEGSGITSALSSAAKFPTSAISKGADFFSGGEGSDLIGSAGADNLGGDFLAGAKDLGEQMPWNSSIENLWNNPSLSGIWDVLKNNSKILAPIAGLGINAYMGNKDFKGEGALNSMAGDAGANAQEWMNYINTGELPPGAKQSLDLAANSAKAAIKSQYAARGMSGSSAEAQDLANVDAQTASQGFNIALKMLGEGIKQQGVASELYAGIMNHSMQQDQSLAAALAKFAASLGA